MVGMCTRAPNFNVSQFVIIINAVGHFMTIYTIKGINWALLLPSFIQFLLLQFIRFRPRLPPISQYDRGRNILHSFHIIWKI